MEEYTASMMGAGPELHDGHWLIAADPGATPEEAVQEMTAALLDADFDRRAHEAAGQDWEAAFERKGVWVYLKEYVPGTTTVDTFAPAEDLDAAARQHAEGVALYLHAAAR